jgi:NhaP-type Na+/H+ and K+/H+ antiporter
VPPEKFLEEVILGKGLKDNHRSDIKSINDEINNILEEMFVLERKWAGLRYKAYSYIKENRAIAIKLAGYLAKNKNIRHMMGMKREHQGIEKIVDKYLWM